MRSTTIVFAVLLGCLATGCESPGFIADVNQQMSPGKGFVRRKITLAGERHRYVIFVPDSYQPQRRYPAILFLHGFGGHGNDGLQQAATGLGYYVADHWKTCQFIVIFPQSKWDWKGEEAQDVALAALEQTQARYNIDPNRVILCGASLGGYGAYCLAARYPDRFAALVTMSGLSEDRVAAKLTTMPVRCFHYETDPIIGCGNSQRMVEQINAAGGTATLTRVPGFGHAVWNQACNDELFDWMNQQRRIHRNDKIEYATAKRGHEG